MKIAILADPIDNQRGGVHVYTRELITALVEQDQANEYILVREKATPAIPGTQSLVVPNYRFGLVFAAFRMLFIIPFLLRRHKVDVVLEPAHFGPFNLPRRVHRVTVIHDLTPLLFPQYHLWHSQLLQRLFLKGILKRASLVITNSRHTQKDVLAHFPFLKGRVIAAHLGANPDLAPVEDRSWLDRQGIEAPYWLTVGTIEPRKNLVRLLDAYQQYRQEGGEALLVVAGQRGWKSEAFFGALSQHPYRQDIRLTGFVPDEALPQLYSHALAMIYPSEYEGFGLPVLEAMCCSCPVICSSVSSLPEVGGEVAYYVDYQQPASIAQQMHAVARLDDQGRAQLKRRAVRWAAQFTWKAHADACREAFQKLAVKQPQSGNV
ncbi:MAG: glycosyltransferase family 1 protein [Phaeodactylibacter sp.]|uniref:glycosyltransferase family 4 protein n=1 Tax=Phaeodactylibacter sp. TaxID=1940289 RepID=UPI0032EFA0E5